MEKKKVAGIDKRDLSQMVKSKTDIMRRDRKVRKIVQLSFPSAQL